MSMHSKSVYIARFGSASQVVSRMQDAFSWMGDGMIKADSRVFIKPNLTYPFYKTGVTTSPDFMEALVQVLLDTTRHITFVESDGGSNAWTADQAMAGHGIAELCQRYGIRMMNLTERPRRAVVQEINGRRITIELSAEMLDESDLFITMPVPKVHVMTYLTLGFKNQWGCIPDVKRQRHHPEFDHTILAVNKLLRTRLGVYDGSYFLDHTGPMEGNPIRKDMVVMSNDIGSGDLICSHLMQIPATKASHLRLAQKVGMMPSRIGDVRLNCSIDEFIEERFHLQRTPMNLLTLAAFHNKLLTGLFYDSRYAKPLHQLLYSLRGRPKDFSPRW